MSQMFYYGILDFNSLEFCGYSFRDNSYIMNALLHSLVRIQEWRPLYDLRQNDCMHAHVSSIVSVSLSSCFLFPFFWLFKMAVVWCFLLSRIMDSDMIIRFCICRSHNPLYPDAKYWRSLCFWNDCNYEVPRVLCGNFHGILFRFSFVFPLLLRWTELKVEGLEV